METPSLDSFFGLQPRCHSFEELSRRLTKGKLSGNCGGTRSDGKQIKEASQ